MPAFISWSLNWPISVSSFSPGSAPASELFVALTITMTRIVVLLSRPASNHGTAPESWRFPRSPGLVLVPARGSRDHGSSHGQIIFRRRPRLELADLRQRLGPPAARRD